MKKMIENEIEETLHSLEGIRRAETRPFFYTRLMAGMNAKHKHAAVAVFSRPALSLATLVLLLLLNIAAIAHFARSTGQPVQQQDGLQSLVSEMSRDLSSVYNDKPTQ